MEELKRIAKPQEGWRPEDFTTDTAETVRDRRNLIDIVTRMSQHLTGVDSWSVQIQEKLTEQTRLLEQATEAANVVQRYSSSFQQMIDWWDQNQSIIESAKQAQDLRNDSSSIYSRVQMVQRSIENVQRAINSHIAAQKTELDGRISAAMTEAQRQVEEARRQAGLAGQKAAEVANARIAELTNGAPQSLDTMREVASELAKQNDAVAAINRTLGAKANSSDVAKELEKKVNLSDVGTDAQAGKVVKRGTHGLISLPSGVVLAPDSAVSRNWVENYVKNAEPKAHKHKASDVVDFNEATINAMKAASGTWSRNPGDYLVLDATRDVQVPYRVISNQHGDVAWKRDLDHRTGSRGATSSIGGSEKANCTVTTDSQGLIHSGKTKATEPTELVNKQYVDALVPWVGSQEEYNNLQHKDANRLYIIK